MSGLPSVFIPPAPRCAWPQAPKTVMPEFEQTRTQKLKKGGETVAVSTRLMTRSAESVYAVQHIRKMRGGSQAHLLRASDNHFYITKFQNNPQDIRILANEYLSTKLGIFLGLPMPEVRIIDVSEWLVQKSPELRVDQGGLSAPCASGLPFGSPYVADPLETAVFDSLPKTVLNQISNLEDFSRVLAFEKWAGNSDGRQAVFIKQPSDRRFRATFIDQGHCFNAGQWDFTDLPLRGVFACSSVYHSVIG